MLLSNNAYKNRNSKCNKTINKLILLRPAAALMDQENFREKAYTLSFSFESKICPEVTSTQV